MKRSRSAAILSFCLFLVACDEKASEDKPASKSLEEFVAAAPIGGDADSWIEMRNMAGEWERTGLIFGYLGDFEECQKAIAGLKKENFAREYRCVPANAKSVP